MISDKRGIMSSKVKTNINSKWTKDSWRSYPIKQQPKYKNQNELQEVEKQLSSRAALIQPSEVRKLTAMLAKVSCGKGFLLQGGDCAESFAEYSDANLKNYFRVMLQMTVALMYGAGKPVVKVGRIAGQFAKPRSEDIEVIDGVAMPSYRGDMVNGIEFSLESREPDPYRMLKSYDQSAATLNYLRSLAKGGYASLENVNNWNKEFAGESSQGKLFKNLVDRINESLAFMEAFGLDLEKTAEIHEADFYTSHEALLLNYEEAMTKQDEDTGEFYDCSAHMLWIGDRTRSLDEAHIEYMSGIANPIGMKVGPSMKQDDLLRLIDKLNPENIPGRLTLITRLGANNVEKLLPQIIRAVQKEGRHVVWSCDPMHGNTIKSPNGYKTRPFNSVLAEVRNVFKAHQQEGSYAGGIHIEMTGQDVTECVGGAQAISEVNLKDRYHTHCDPRLNASQSIELAFLIAEELREAI
jgi:3-deoxy-7-phosphoheptulonate synthase